jgi:ArsR family transcriptional regulator
MKPSVSGKKKSVIDRPFEILHILSDANRLQILRVLAENGELCAREILEFFPITQPTLSHHMNVLLDNRMVEARKSGRWVFYQISESCLEDLISFFVSLKETASVHDRPAAAGSTISKRVDKVAVPAKKPYVEPVSDLQDEVKPKKNKSKDEKEKKKDKKKKKSKKKNKQ